MASPNFFQSTKVTLPFFPFLLLALSQGHSMNPRLASDSQPSLSAFPEITENWNHAKYDFISILTSSSSQYSLKTPPTNPLMTVS